MRRATTPPRDDGMKLDEYQPNHRRLAVAGTAAGLTVAGILALTAPFVLSRSPLPYMATPGRKVNSALMHIIDHGGSKSLFVDLGSGDGDAIHQALKAGFNRAVGIELNYTLYALACFRRQFWTADERSRSTFLCKNFFDFDCSAADVVMIFGVNPLMTALSKKLASECSPGTFVLSYRFLLPLEVSTSQTSELLKANVVYDKEEMRVYECLKVPCL